MIAVSSQRVRCRSLPAAKQAASLKCRAYSGLTLNDLVWPLTPLLLFPLYARYTNNIHWWFARPTKMKTNSTASLQKRANTQPRCALWFDIWETWITHTPLFTFGPDVVLWLPWLEQKRKALKARQTCKGKKTNLLFVSKKVKVLMRDARGDSTKGKLGRAARLSSENRPLLSLK